ncbi:MAG: OmpA family protein [Elusimicrobia bacterium]|nr:OmpA family protein [Candidatus Obscuribacterium magneticum]
MPLKSRDVIDASDPRVAQIGHPAPPWMVNYADLMTELVCFYLILYALSASLSKPIQEAKKAVEETMKQEEVAGEVKITKDGLIISLQEQGYNVFFESGRAELTDQMKKILDGLAPTFRKLADKRHDIIVEGHTDDVPIKSDKFPSNWELSTARATNVVHYLIHQYQYPPQHIGAIGYGENKSLPRAPEEDLVAWRSRNRRVVFVVKNPEPDLKAEKAEAKKE